MTTNALADLIPGHLTSTRTRQSISASSCSSSTPPQEEATAPDDLSYALWDPFGGQRVCPAATVTIPIGLERERKREEREEREKREERSE
jgi:hypothetical protein